MSFARDMNAFTARLHQRYNDIFVKSAMEVHRSVVEGSELTGAPGQPVDTGFLKTSWVLSFPEPHVATSLTATEYAPEIEHNTRGATLRSEVGGFHSVAMTRAGWQNIADAVVAEVVR